MSEETPPAKKATKKTVRKKSAAKRAPRKSAKSDSNKEAENELPLNEDQKSSGEARESQSKGREPKTGVRDARRETAEEPISNEISEKLVPDGDEGKGGKDSKEKESHSSKKPVKEDPAGGSKEQGQGRQESGERRSRGRGRGGRERGEKREPKPRVTVDSKDLAKKAWKIFESEVTEEGLALLDDGGLRDYARSSFNAARIFLEEKGRIDARDKQVKEERKRAKSQKEKDENNKEEKDD